MPAGLGRAPGRRAAGLGERQGRHPRDAAPARRRRRGGAASSSTTAPGSTPSRPWTGTSSPTWAPSWAPPRTVFPSDDEVRALPRAPGPRGRLGRSSSPIPGAGYDVEEEIDLAALEPLIAMPSSPATSSRCARWPGEPIYQAYVGSSANPGFRDFAVAAEMVRGRQVDDRVSFDVNPTSRQILADLAASGHLGALIAAGARLHQAGCNGCIGMGQAPASRRDQPAHGAAQLPRPLRHPRGQGVPGAARRPPRPRR